MVHFFNLYHVYMYYNDNGLKWNWIYDIFADADFLGTWLRDASPVLSVRLVAGLFALHGPVAFAFAYRRGPPDSEAA